MKIKQTIDYNNIKGLPYYNGSEIAIIKSEDALSTYKTISQEEIREEINLKKEVLSNGEIEKYDRL